MLLTRSNLLDEFGNLNVECQKVYEDDEITIGQLLGGTDDQWLLNVITDVLEGGKMLLEMQEEYNSVVRP